MNDAESRGDSGDRFLELITAIADGQLVDWPRLQAAAQTEADRQILAEMRRLAEVAAAHRTDNDFAVEETPERPRRDTSRVRPAKWGNLDLFERLGEGAFGEVYRAHDPDLVEDKKEVALKLFWPASPSSDHTVREKALREARSLALVRDTNVARVYNVELHNGRWGMWLEFVRGQTLAELLQRQGRSSAEEATLIGLQLCKALAAVHAAGLIHRDVKAHNVMREEGGRVVLMDFGAAHEIGGVAATLGGTPLYLAPELLYGRDATVCSDIYSLGVLLFHLVTDKYPFQGNSIEEIRDAHGSGLRVSASDFRPDLPKTFVAILDKALSLDPLARYESTSTMRTDLEAYLQRRGSADRPPDSTRRIGLFVSYAHEDAKVIERLKVFSYLNDLKREGCDVWSDYDLRPGDDWNEVVRARLRTADILVPLVTQDYLQSRFCSEVEIGESLPRRLTSGLVIFPIIVSPCNWQQYAWLRATHFLPRQKSVIEYRGPGRKEQLLVSAFGELKRLANRLREAPPPPSVS